MQAANCAVDGASSMPTAMHSRASAWLQAGFCQTPKFLMRLGSSMAKLSPKDMVMDALPVSHSRSQSFPLQHAQATPQ